MRPGETLESMTAPDPIIEVAHVTYYMPRRMGDHAAGMDLTLRRTDEHGATWLYGGHLRLQSDDSWEITITDEDGQPVLDPVIDRVGSGHVLVEWETRLAEGAEVVV